MARRELGVEGYSRWKAQWDKASSAMPDNRVQQFQAAAAEAERDLTFLGVSAVEDRLQDGVPGTIAALRRAGIRVWVLTGDKVETAVEIARSCQLFEDRMPLAYITDAANTEQALDLLGDAFGSLSRNSPRRTSRGVPSFFSGGASFGRPSSRGIVLDGSSLQHILASAPAKQALFELAQTCGSCVCCRLSPLQKRELVELVRELSGCALTLAVGDGANDVPMIQGAHVGVGIRGKEGSAAVQASDLAISEFRFLGRVVLFHGRKAYQRLAIFLCYFMYKSLVIGCSYLLYACSVSFKGLRAFPDWLDAMYSPLTSVGVAWLLLCDRPLGQTEQWWPVMRVASEASFRDRFAPEDDQRFAAAQRQIEEEVARHSPDLYKSGPSRAHLNVNVYVRWMLFALWHGVLAWQVPFSLLFDSADYMDQNRQFWTVSFTAFTIIVVVVHLRVLVVAEKPIRPLDLAFLVAELVGYVVVSLVMNFFGKSFCRELVGVPWAVISSPRHVVALVLVPMAALCVDLVLEVVGLQR